MEANMKIENIIIAMRLSSTRVLPEGYLYDLLFKEGMSPEEATRFIRDLLKTGKIERIGCAFVLNKHGEEGSFTERAVCNS
jgi:hypothetical protein